MKKNSSPVPTAESTFAQMDALYEKARKLKRSSWLILLIYPVLWFGPDLLGIYIGGASDFVIILYGILAVPGPFVAFAIMRNRAVKAKKAYGGFTGFFKDEVVKKELDAAFSNAVFNPDHGWPMHFIQSLGLFKEFNLYDSDDYIAGHYNNLPFEQADINLVEEHEESYWDSEDNCYRTRTVRTSIFHGRLIAFDFEDQFPTDLRILSTSFGGMQYTASTEVMVGGKTTVKSARIAGWQNIETESVDFTRAFHSFAIDAGTALVMLTPQIILHILDVQASLGMPIALYFKANKLYIFLRTGGRTFEVSSNKKAAEQVARAKEDVAFISRSLEAVSGIARDFINASFMMPIDARIVKDEVETAPAGTVYVLEPKDADLSQAPNVIVEGKPNNLGGWLINNVVAFRFHAAQAGRYGVVLEYAKPSTCDTADVQVTAGGHVLRAQLPATGSTWSLYTNHYLGALVLPAGEITLQIASANPKPRKKLYVMNLRSITLVLEEG